MEKEQRLIDVNKVISSMQKCLDEDPDPEGSIAYTAFDLIIKCLKQEPTVDAVEVVRCKDCIYRAINGNCHGRPMDFFCANGKRRYQL